MNMKPNCPNMNHGKSNVTISYCPNCGFKMKANLPSKCNSTTHAASKKNRFQFCSDCGKKL